MKTTEVTFRKTVFDITHDEGIIEAIEHNGIEVQGLMFDMGFLGDFTTALLEKIASDEMDAAQQAVEAAREIND